VTFDYGMHVTYHDGMHPLTGTASSRGVTARAAANQKAAIPSRPKSQAPHRSDLSSLATEGVFTKCSLSVHSVPRMFLSN